MGIDDVDWITIGVLVTNNLNNVADQAAWARDAHALLTTIARLPDESDLYGALTQAETQLAAARITIERQTIRLLDAAAPPPQVTAARPATIPLSDAFEGDPKDYLDFKTKLNNKF